MQKKHKIIFMIILIIGILARIYKLYDIPYGINVDEAGMFVDASMLSKYGVDRLNKSFPVYLENFGGGQSVMYAYLTALLIKLFSNSYSLIRVVSVIFGIIVIIFSYLISKEFVNKKKALLIMSLASFCPYFIQASRIGLDCNLFLGMFLISLYSMIKALKNKKNILYIISGILFGLCFYTYAISYLVISIFLFISLIYLYKNKYINKKQTIIFLISTFVIILPIILFLMVNYGILKDFKIFIFSFNKLSGFRGGEINPFYVIINIRKIPEILFYDMIEYNALPYFTTIYYTFIPFFIIGIILYTKKIIKEKEFKLENLIYIMFISNIIAMMCIDSPNINKNNGIFFSVIYFTVYGIYSIKNKTIIKLIPILLIISFIIFSIYYYKIYNHNDNAFFEAKTYKIINTNYEKFKNKNILIYTKNIEDYIYEKLGKITKINNKEEILNINKEKEFNLNSICIVDKENYLKYKMYFKNEKVYNNYYILYN